jgi:hypothetical protein
MSPVRQPEHEMPETTFELAAAGHFIKASLVEMFLPSWERRSMIRQKPSRQNPFRRA